MRQRTQVRARNNPRPTGDRAVAVLSREELMALFRWYEFVEAEGHRLENCQDFLDLIDRACEASPEPIALAPPLLIEMHEDDGVDWIVSLGGYNPTPAESVRCANREEAERCIALFEQLMKGLPSHVRHAMA